MQFKIIRQDATGHQILFAEFHDLNDAKLVIHQILLNENEKNKFIYRLYDHHTLLDNINPCHIPIKTASQLPSSIIDPFNIMIRNTPHSELILAQFSYLIDAKQFVKEKIKNDVNQHVEVTYYIFDGDKLVEKCDKTTITSNEKKQIFRPTPLLSKPRLGPGGYWVDEDEDKKDN